MTPPRQILPGATVVVMRRTRLRQFLLRPDPVVNQIFAYTLALASARYGVEVHAAVALGNHYHLHVTDVLGRLPDFMAYLNRMMALALKQHFGVEENVWSQGRYSIVEPLDEDATLCQLVYVLNNPSRAGLVRYRKDWPGFITRPDACLFGPVVVKRPDGYFPPGGRTPDEVELRVTQPPRFAHLLSADYVELLETALAIDEREIRAEMARAGRTFAGA